MGTIPASDGVTQIGNVPPGQVAGPKNETQAQTMARKRAKRLEELERLVALAPENAAEAAAEILSRPDVVNAANILLAARAIGGTEDALARIARHHLAQVSKECAPIVAGLDLAEQREHEAAKREREAAAKVAQADAADAAAAQAQALADKTRADAAAARAAADKMKPKPPTAAPEPLAAPKPDAQGGKKK
jgi:hypothetical protein